MVFIVILNIGKGGVESIAVVLSLSLLDEHHFLNCRDQIELLDVFTEFS
jgi:hypothetical protein